MKRFLVEFGSAEQPDIWRGVVEATDMWEAIEKGREAFPIEIYAVFDNIEAAEAYVKYLNKDSVRVYVTLLPKEFHEKG